MRLIFLALFFISAGCQQNALPRYPDVTASDARTILAQRAAAVHTLSAHCDVNLRRADGQSIELDGIIVLAPPDRLHLRTWKMSQAVLDLTVLSDGLWIETPGDPARAAQLLSPNVSAREFSRQMLWMTGGFFADPNLKSDQHADTFNFRSDLDGGGAVICEVDRATLTPRSYQVRDVSGKNQFLLKLSDYRQFAGIPWPTHLEARDPSGSRITISMHDLHLNEPLTDQAFVPPSGAKKRP